MYKYMLKAQLEIFVKLLLHTFEKKNLHLQFTRPDFKKKHRIWIRKKFTCTLHYIQ